MFCICASHKNTAGDLWDASNYRAIAISNSCSMVLELVMYNYFRAAQPDVFDDHHQVGFKKSHSTGLCTHVLKSTVDYHVSRGSHVFCCFVNFSKAFDCDCYGCYSLNCLTALMTTKCV